MCVYVSVCLCVKLLEACPTLQPYEPQPTRLLCLWDSSGMILEWVAMPSSRGSSRPRDPAISLMSPVLAVGFFSISIT